MAQRRITTHKIQQMKRRGEPIPMVTAYDYTAARIVDALGDQLETPFAVPGQRRVAKGNFALEQMQILAPIYSPLPAAANASQVPSAGCQKAA